MNIMIPKYSLFILLSVMLLSSGVILSTTNPAFATINAWTGQSNTNPVPTDLQSVFFTDVNNGWAVGLVHNPHGRGQLQHTTDGGTTWETQTNSTERYLFDVFFLDANTGWVSGSFDNILHTTDGGTTWITQRDDSSGTQLGSIFFIDVNNGWATGYGGVILHTTDGGTTWESQDSGTTVYLRSVSFVDASNGSIVGDHGVILHTTNGGDDWTPLTSGISNNLNDITFVGNNGWLVGSGGVILHTEDGGTTWESQTSGTGYTLESVSFIDANNGLISGHDGIILQTTNGGETWRLYTTITSEILHSVSFVDVDNGWATGYNGVILHGSDTLPPPVPAINQPTTPTNVSAATITGTAEANSSITLTHNNDNSLPAISVNSDGNWSVDVTLVDGQNTFTATATDDTGNQSNVSAPVVITLDVSAPPAPAINQPTTPTNVSAATITGTAEANSSITLTHNNDNSLPAISVNSDGNWSVDVTLVDGQNTFTATATDDVGNQSNVSAPVVITLDVLAPSAPAINQPTTPTNVSAATITGTAEANSSITLTHNNDNSLPAISVNSDGNWSVDVTLVDGQNTFTATATDDAGNQSNVSAPVVITLDVLAPSAPAINQPTTPTNVSAATITGTAEANSSITLTHNNDNSLPAISVNSDGNWSVDVTLVDGQNTFTATATDDAGNQSNVSAPVVITLDVLAPSAPAINQPTTPTNVSAATITGTAEANSSITLTHNNDNSLPAISVNSDGNWSVDVTLVDGQNTFTATATDDVGNQSNVSAPVVITLDVSAPSAPAINQPTTPTNVSAATITGTAEANSSITLTHNNDNSLPAISVNSDGNWSVDVTLVDGQNTFTATATDDAGNQSNVSAPVVITLDVSAPSAPAINQPTTPTNVSAATITGTAEANSSITLTHNNDNSLPAISVNSDGNWSVDVTLVDGQNTFTATATDDAGNQSNVSAPVVITLDVSAPSAPAINQPTTPTNVSAATITGTAEANSSITLTHNNDNSLPAISVNSDGNWSVDVTLVDGQNTFTATATDDVGNQSNVSAPVVITLDVSAPSAPAINQPTTPTNVSAATITGTAEANSSITLTHNNDNSLPAISVNSDGNWSVDVTLVDGQNTFTATATDDAGNQSNVSAPVVITLDDNNPPVPAINQPTTPTNVSAATITGTAEANSSITLTHNNDNSLPAISVNSDGNWSVDVTLVDGQNTFTATATDDVGNQSNVSAPVVITLDVSAPSAPAINQPTTPTNVSAATITGTAEANSSITLTHNNDNSLPAISVNSDGNWSVDVTLVDGQNTFTATATDDVGNQSNVSAPVVITLDDNNPPVPAINQPTTPTNVSAATITGTAEANSSITLTHNNDNSLPAISVNSDGNWSVDVTLVDGQNTFTATATDDAGNQSNVSAPVVITLDDNNPPVPAINQPTTPTNVSAATITGTAEANSSITLTHNNDNSLPAISVNSDGNWSVDVTLVDGQNTFTATATDDVGNQSNVSAPVVITLDDNNPPVPAINQPTTPTNVSAATITGTAEANSSITLTHNNDNSLPAISVNSDGNWSVDVTLVDGQNTFTATATDDAGNQSNVSAPVVITLDDNNPPVPAINQPTTPTNVSAATITGTAEANSSITLTHNNDNSLPAISVNSDGNWSVDVTLVDGQNTFTATATDDVGNTSLPSNSITITFDIPSPETPKKKSGGSSNDWKKKPTFGKSWEITTAQIVENGFTFNGYTLDITDNWHTDFLKTDSIIGDTNHVEIKVYTDKILKYVTLSLGVPEIGDLSNAETDIIVYLQRNYTNVSGYDIIDTVHEQKESLVDSNHTTSSITPVKCTDDAKNERCYLIGIDFTVNAPLKSNVLAISAVDLDRRSTVTFINEGVEFIGESLLDAKTHSIFVKTASQNPAESLLLTQQDRRYNVYEDSNGYLWTVNDYGSWTQITKPDFERHIDAPSTVMTRVHSGFASLIIDEQDKAVLIFDGTKLVSVLPESFSYEYDTINRDLSKLEILSKELYVEELKAQIISDEMSELRSLVDD